MSNCTQGTLLSFFFRSLKYSVVILCVQAVATRSNILRSGRCSLCTTVHHKGKIMSNTSTGSEEPQDPTGIDGRKVQLPVSSNKRLVRLDYKCSFCFKLQDEVRRLIAGPNKVYICDECIGLCNEIIGDDYDQPSYVIETLDSIAEQLKEKGEGAEGVPQALAAITQMRELVSVHADFLSHEFLAILVKTATASSNRFHSG